MKAVQIHAYGGSEVLEINKNAVKPTPGKGQVLVQIHAASINPFDIFLIAGFMKDNIPLQFPFTVGGDFSGIIVQSGEGVTEFNVGDQVYGTAQVLGGGSGSFAEFASANCANIALKPINSNFIEAASLPLVGSSAIQSLEEHIKLASGQKILIHGGAGGIGHIAIKLAKAMGAYVATTVSTKNIEFVKSLGADEIIDYTTQKFEDICKDYDAVFDNAGGETTTKSFLVLKKSLPAGRQGGILVSMKGQPDPALATQYGVTAIGQGTKTDTSHLVRLKELVESGTITVHVDKIFPIEEIKDAWTYKQTGHPRGKVVLLIQE